MTEPNGLLLSQEVVRNILVIKLNRLGDVLLSTPVLSNLKHYYPDARLDVLLYAGTEAMLAANPEVNNIFKIDRTLKKRGPSAQIRGERSLFQQIKATYHDLIVNLSDHWRAAIYCRLLKPRYSIGFTHERRNRLLWGGCHTMLANRSNRQAFSQHEVLNNLGILAPLGFPKVSTKVTMSYGQADVDRFNQLRVEHRLKDYVVIQPTAHWAFKTWPARGFSRVIDYLSTRDETVVLTSGQDGNELATIDEILAGADPGVKIVNLAGQLTITQLAVLIERAKLFIGLDSAPMHMAAALGTPSVALFGPTNLPQWYPWQAPHTLLWAGSYRELPHFRQINTATKERYLAAIPAEVVIKAVKAWLDKRN